MIEEIRQQFFQGGFLPHGDCLSWSPTLAGTYIVSDVLIFLAYSSMTIALCYFARRRADFPHKWLLWMVSALILACGATHLMSTVILWQPLYWVDATLKAITAVISVATAIVLWPMIPRALAVPSHTQLQAVNEELQAQIAERQRVEEELRLANDYLLELQWFNDASLAHALHRLDAHMRNSPLAVIELDTDCQVIRWSETAERLFGWRGDEVLGRRLDAVGLVHEDDAPGILKILEALRSGAAAQGNNTNRNRCKDGSVVICEWYNSATFDDGGCLISSLHLALDVTERTRIEAQVRQLNADLEKRVEERTAELTAANRELEAFTFATSHDLRGPLGRLNSFSTLLEQQYRDKLEGNGLLYLEFIRQNSIRLGHLVDDLVQHARIAQQDLDLEPVEIWPQVVLVVEECADDIREVNADVQIDVPPVAVLGDAQALAQVLLNLIQNALKYSAASTPPVIRIGGEVQGTSVLLWVNDNGIGFDMIYHDKIFEIFRRLHTHNEYAGTGVGLALVKRAMERMDGRVWADSKPGQGTTFFLKLQLADSGSSVVA